MVLPVLLDIFRTNELLLVRPKESMVLAGVLLVRPKVSKVLIGVSPVRPKVSMVLGIVNRPSLLEAINVLVCTYVT
jgi:hypothetical protein